MSDYRPNLSLLDSCLGYLIKHPEIDLSSLPSELLEHLNARNDDSKYRVNPEYNRAIEYEITPTIQKYLDDVSLISLADTPTRARKIIELYEYICRHRFFLNYNVKFGLTTRNKLNELYFNPAARPYHHEWNRLHHFLFGSKIRMDPPQHSYGVRGMKQPKPTANGQVSRIPHLTKPLIEGWIELRPLEESDSTALSELSSDPQFRQFIPVPASQDEARKFIQLSQSERHASKSCLWAIVLVETQQLIGCIGLFQIHWAQSRGQIGYWIDPTIPNQDISSTAIRLVSILGFSSI